MGEIAKKGIIITFLNFIGVFLGAISVLFVQTKFLTKIEIGSIRTLISLTTFILPFTVLGLNSSVIKFYHKASINKKVKNVFITYTFFIPLSLSLILFCISFFYGEYFIKKFIGPNNYLPNLYILIPILVLHYSINAIIEAFLSIKLKIIVPNILTSINTRFYIIVLSIIYGFGYINFDQLLITLVLLYLLNTLILFFIFLKNFGFSISFNIKKQQLFKEVRLYTYYMILGMLSSSIVTQIDVIMIGGILKDLGEVGIYTVAMFVGTVVEIPKRPIIQMLSPIISRDITNDLNNIKKLYTQSAINLSLLGILVFMVIWVNIDDLFLVIPNGDAYSKGKYVVFFIALAKVFDLSLGINFEIIQYSKYYKWNLLLSPFLALITVICNLIFLYVLEMGIVGTAAATALTVLLYNIVRSSLIYYKFKFHSFSYKHIQIIIVGIGVYGVSNLLTFTDNPYCNILIKSVFSCFLYLSIIYKLNISEEINRIIINSIKKLRNKI